MGGPDIRLIPLGVDTDALCPQDQRSSREMLKITREPVVLLPLVRFSEQEKAALEPFLTLLDLFMKAGQLERLEQGRGR